MTVLALAAGCKSAANCIGRLPPELQADVVRLAIDEGFVRREEIPYRDHQRAMLEGLPPGEHDPQHRRLLRQWAVRYQICTKDATTGER